METVQTAVLGPSVSGASDISASVPIESSTSLRLPGSSELSKIESRSGGAVGPSFSGSGAGFNFPRILAKQYNKAQSGIPNPRPSPTTSSTASSTLAPLSPLELVRVGVGAGEGGIVKVVWLTTDIDAKAPDSA